MVLGGTDNLDTGTWFVTHILFDQKFLSIFAMLFGAGLILMTGRAEERGAKYGRIFLRRQFWLLILGALHGYFIWVGDILFMYAAIGMVAYLFRNRTPRTLIIVAVLLLPLTLLLNFGLGLQVQKIQVKAAEFAELQQQGDELSQEQQKILAAWKTQRVYMAPTEAEIQREVDIHKGSYIEIMAYRIPIVKSLQIYNTLLLDLWRVLALMLIGMALMKTGVLAAERAADSYRKMMLSCYGLGLPLTAYSAINLHAHDFDPLYELQVGMMPNYYGSLIVGLGHIGLVMLLIKTGFVQNLLRRFAAVGRMALTNYLMHSVILTTVFYGYGLNLYAEVGRFAQMGFVVAVIVLQLYSSPWWLARYRFGPVEWLWRSLTYWQRQPMKRTDLA